MAKVADNYHLLRRGGTYYYQRRVPDGVAAVIGKRVIKFSLKTTDKKIAKQRRAIADLEWDARFEAALASPDDRYRLQPSSHREDSRPISSEIEQIIRNYVSARTINRLADSPSNEDERRQMIENVATEIGILKNADDPRADESVYFTGRQILAQIGINDENLPMSYSAFAELVRRALLEIDRRKLASLEDDHCATHFDRLFDPSRAPPVTFGQLTAQFLKMREEDASVNAVGRQNVDRLRAQVSLMREIIGDDTPVAAINHDACLDARSTLARVPTNRTKLYGKLSLANAIEIAAKDGKPSLSSLTQSQYLAVFRDIIDLAAKKRLIPINFADGMTPIKRDDVARGDKRRPFGLDQIAAFFMSEFYQECVTSGREPFRHDKTHWRFWLPLLCLFMGFRPNEVCQLDAADIKRTPNGVWFIDAVETDDDDNSLGSKKTLKTKASRRRVPLHPEILALGFLSFVRSQQTVGGRLFPQLKPNKYGNSAWYALKRFNEVFLPKAIKMEERQSFYSLRHSFRDALRRAKADHDTMQALGWSQDKLVSDDYGERSNPDVLAEFMPSIAFPGLDLSHLRAKADDGANGVKV